MENNIEKAEVREMIRQFSAEFSSLLATRPGSTAGSAAAIRSLDKRRRQFILTIPVRNGPMLDEARYCADMLNKLDSLKRAMR